MKVQQAPKTLNRRLVLVAVPPALVLEGTLSFPSGGLSAWLLFGSAPIQAALLFREAVTPVSCFCGRCTESQLSCFFPELHRKVEFSQFCDASPFCTSHEIYVKRLIGGICCFTSFMLLNRSD